MITYSQKDPQYGNRKIPQSNLTMTTHGCFITSLAMLAQKHPTDLLRNEFFKPGGYIVSSVAARSLGMQFQANTRTPPKSGWCIGVTRHYAPKYPTHFFLVNPSEGLQVDPLLLEPRVEPLTYRCYQYRIFSGSPLNDPKRPVVPEWAIDSVRKAHRKGITTDLMTKMADIPLYQLYTLLDKYIS